MPRGETSRVLPVSSPFTGEFSSLHDWRTSWKHSSSIYMESSWDSLRRESHVPLPIVRYSGVMHRSIHHIPVPSLKSLSNIFQSLGQRELQPTRTMFAKSGGEIHNSNWIHDSELFTMRNFFMFSFFIQFYVRYAGNIFPWVKILKTNVPDLMHVRPSYRNLTIQIESNVSCKPIFANQHEKYQGIY